MTSRCSTMDVFAMTLPAALASGLGALPFVWTSSPSRRFLGICNACAAGVMLAASFGLVNEGIADTARLSPFLVPYAVGVVFGLLFGQFSYDFLEAHKLDPVGDFTGLGGRKALLVLGVMTLHAFAEGMGMGVAFAGDLGMRQGVFVSSALGLHNIPEGLAVALVMVPRGCSVLRAALWAIVSSLPQPLVAIPAFMFVETFQMFHPIGLGVAAGCMIWLALAELIPDSFECGLSYQTCASVVTMSIAVMLFFEACLGHWFGS